MTPLVRMIFYRIVSVSIPLIIPGQTVESGCNAEFCCKTSPTCSIGDISGRFGWPRLSELTPCCLRKSAAPWPRSEYALSCFHQCTWQKQLPLGVKLDQCNVDRSSYLVPLSIPPFGST